MIFPYLEPYADPALRDLGNTSEQSAKQKAAISRKIRKKSKSKTPETEGPR